MALTNGDVLYVAEEDAFFPGSSIYGVHPHMAAMAVPGSDAVLSDAAIRALRQAKGA